MISGIGPSSTKIMIVGDYPTKEDQINNIALSGKSESIIKHILSRNNLRLDEIYRTLYIKEYIPGVETKNKRKRNELIYSALQQEDWKALLIQEIEAIKPNVIIALGEQALNILTNEKKIINFRGSILNISPYFKFDFHPKVLPTYHPRQIWEDYISLAYVQVDYSKIKKVINLQGPYQTDELLWIARNYSQLFNWWNERGKFARDILVFDIETYFNTITCTGFCVDKKEALSVPLVNLPSSSDSILTYKLINEILGSKIPKVNQNIAYDEYHYNRWGFQVNNIYDDTMLLGHAIYPELPKNLAFYTSIYTTFPFYKDEGKEFDPRLHSMDQLFLYNAKDCLVTYQIYEAMKEDAKELKVYNFHRQNYFEANGRPSLYHIYRKIESNGIRIDEARRKWLLNKYNSLIQIHQAKIESVYGKHVNYNSPKQVAQFVYEYLECPHVYHINPSGDRVLSTDKETLEDLYINKVKNSTVQSALGEIIILRKLDTVKDTIERKIHPDGRFRTAYKLHGTKSGRTSATFHHDRHYYINDNNRIEYEEYGASIQTIPKRDYEFEEFKGETYGADIPSMFIPSDNYVFVEIDGKNAEAFVVFTLAGDFESLEYAKTNDIHRLTASWILKKPIDQITKYEREHRGKRPRHAGHYDMEAYRFSLMIHEPIHICSDVLMEFHKHAPLIRGVFHRLIQENILQYGSLTTPHERRRDFFGRRDKELFKEGYSYIPQAVVSDHTKFSMPYFVQECPETRLLAEKHDSIFAEIPKEKLEVYAPVYKRIYERSIDFRKGSIKREYDLVIPAEIKYSLENWGDMKEYDL